MVFMPIYLSGQSSCSSAVFHENDLFTEHQFQSSQSEYWIYFTAVDTLVQVKLMKPQNSPSSTIDEIELLSGSCGSLSSLKTQSISQTDSVLTYENLSIGNDYYLAVKKSGSNPDYFGLYLQASCLSNSSLACPLPDCNLVPNGDFSTLGQCLINYLASNPNFYSSPSPNTGGSQTFFAVFKDPLNLNVNPTSALYDNVCGWAKSPYMAGTTGNGVHPAVHFENGNYFLMVWAYSNVMEIFHTELNDGNTINPGPYQLQFDSKIFQGANYFDEIEIYLSNVENTFSGNEILLGTLNYANTIWQTKIINVDYTQAMQTGGYKYLHFKSKGTQNSSTGNAVNVCVDNVKFIPFGITSSTPSPICSNEELNITATFCSSEEYITTIQWTSSPIDPTMTDYTVAGTSILTAFPTTTTTYTCTMTTSTGITASESITIDVNPAPIDPIVEVPSFTNCDANQQYNIANYNLYSTGYTWSYEIDIIGQSKYVISIPNGQSYFDIDWSIYSLSPSNRAEVTVVVETSKTGCKSSFSFEVFECCNQGIPNPNLVWNDKEFANGTSQYSGEQFVINGVLTLDNYELTIENSTLFMGGMAKINTINGGKLIVSECQFQSCDQLNMWDGMYSNSYANGDLIFLDVNNVVLDAINPIVSNHGGYFAVIDGNEFTDCYNGIIVNEFSGDHQGQVYGNNMFNGNSSLTMYPHIAAKSKNGLYIEDVVANSSTHYLPIGQDGLGTNSFDNYEVAALILNSDVKFENNQFTNNIIGISNTGNINSSANTARRIIIGGSSSSAGNSFENNNTNDIENQLKTDLTITYNTFTNHIGPLNIFVHNSKENMIDIGNNNFNGWTNISVNLNKNSSEINIHNNTFTCNSPNPVDRFIWVEDNINSGSFIASTTVNNNSISNAREGLWLVNTNTTTCSGNYLSDVQQGIYSSLANQVFINGNEYTHNAVSFPMITNPFFGISINYVIGSGSQINGNTIIANNYSPIAADVANVVGIFIEASSNYQIKNNSILNFASGFLFKGMNPESRIECNKWSSCFHGVSLDNALIGEFNNPTNTYFVGNHDHVNTIDISYDNKWVNNIDPYRIAGTVNTFTGLYQYKWIYDSSPSQYNPNNIQPTAMTALLANQASNHCGAPMPIVQTPAAKTSNTAFKESLRYKFYGARIEAINAQGSTVNIANEDFYNLIKYLYFGLKNDSTLINLGTQNDQLYQGFINMYEISDIGRLYNALRAAQSGDSIKAYTKLQAMNPTGFSGLVTNDVMSIYTRKLSHNQKVLSTQDTNILLAYAFLNTNAGGDEVYLARNMLGLYITNPLITPSKARVAGGLENGEDENKAIVFPNPSEDIVYIDYTFNNESSYWVEVLDVSGRRVINSNIDISKAKVNLSFLESGVYLLRLFENNLPILSEKVIKN